MNGGAANFDSHDGVEGPDGGLEGLEVPVLVWENTKMACVDPKTDTSVYILLRGFEPRIGLGLLREYRSAKVLVRCRRDRTCLKMWWSRASYAS